MNDENRDEAQIAKKIVGLLDESLEQLDQQTLARLAHVRSAAVAAAKTRRAVHVPELVVAGWGRLTEASHHGGYRFWLPVLLLLALFAGVISSQMASRNTSPIDTDSLLLASELPPEVYADKEFVAWLEHTSRP
jgi:hypothetical protein